MTASGAPEPGRTLAGRYRLRAELGRGGAGSVWLARDDVLDRAVAVKLLHEGLERQAEAVARFRREATAAASLTHPNAVVVYDIGEDDEGAFLVMEYVAGPTLADVLAGGPLAPEDAAAVGAGVARALGAAHGRDLVHRDVKPGNVLLTRDGIPKVADFGIATALGDAQARLTRTGTVVGTGAYLAPEQLEDGPLDARADVYALGLVLHECLTGRPAFTGGTASELAARRLTGDVPAPSTRVAGVPEELDLAVARATRRDPSQRFADGTELAAALAPLVSAHAAGRLARVIAARVPPSDPPEPADTGGTGPSAAGDTADAPAADGPGAGDTAVVTGAPENATTTSVARAGPRSGDRTAAMAATPPASAPAPAPAPGPPQERRAEHAPDASEPPPRRSRWAGPLPWALVLVVLALFAVAIVDVIRSDAPGDGSPGDQPAGEADELSVQTSGAFDPFGSGEHPEDAPKAFDDDPGTSWQTQRYNSAPLGGLKPGVGLWADLGEAVALQRLGLALTPAGADLSVYLGTDPLPEADAVGSDWSPDQWGERVATLEGAERDETLELDGAQARYVLLWFTSLPPDGGRHRVHVGDVSLTR